MPRINRQGSTRALPDGYTDRVTLAKAWGISTKTIGRYEKESPGLPFVRLGLRKVYWVTAANEWLRAREVQFNKEER